MTITCPDYIPLIDICRPEILYEWDSWDPYVPLGERNEDTMDRLSQLSNRAIIAYSIACAEWVVCRLSKQLESATPFEFIEACWAFQMDKGYQAPHPLKEKDWQGPIFGALDLALVTILNTYYTTEEDAAETEAALGELLALHVLDDKVQFNDWRGRILEKLLYYYPRSMTDVWGEPVPREALNPNLSLDVDKGAEFVSNFLNSIDFDKNRLLKYVPGGDNTQ